MPDNEHRVALLLRNAHNAHRALTYLRYAAGRGCDICVGHRLDGVDYYDVRIKLVGSGNDAVKIGFGQDIHLAAIHAEPRCAQLQLPLTLLTCDIQDLPVVLHRAAHLQQKRGLADSWGAADQNQRANDRAAAEHTVKFRDAGAEAYLRRSVKLRQRARLFRLM